LARTDRPIYYAQLLLVCLCQSLIFHLGRAALRPYFVFGKLPAVRPKNKGCKVSKIYGKLNKTVQNENCIAVYKTFWLESLKGR
jgi:hypothetical protein